MAKPSVDHSRRGFDLSKRRPGFMPTTGQLPTLEDDIFERRSKGRTTTNRDALIFFNGNDAVHPCCVRDVTNDGAGVRLDGLSVMPSEFGISFDRFLTMRECRMIWREGDFLGVVFKG
jgi:hypothetical protein